MIETNTITTLVGLIGITIIITGGKIFDGLRKWLLGFAIAWNPLRILGEIMSCTMCAGWWVGFVWALCAGHGWASIVMGGVVSVAAFTADEALTILAAHGVRAARMLRPAPPPPAPTPPPPRPQRAPEDKSISESEAHAILDAEERTE